jgi:hypothetical protein
MKAENFLDFVTQSEETDMAEQILDNVTAEANKAENFMDFAAHPISTESENAENFCYTPNTADDFLAYTESTTAQNFNTEDDNELVEFDKSMHNNGISSDNLGLDNNNSDNQEDTSAYTQLHYEEEHDERQEVEPEQIDTTDMGNTYEEYNFTQNLDAPIIIEEPPEEIGTPGKITISLPGRPKSPKKSPAKPPAWVEFDDSDTLTSDVSGSPKPNRPSAPPSRPSKPARPPKPKPPAPPRPAAPKSAPPRPAAPPKKEDTEGMFRTNWVVITRSITQRLHFMLLKFQ